MKTFSHVVIPMVTRIQLSTKYGIYHYMIKKWSLIIFVFIINVKFWHSGIYVRYRQGRAKY